MLRDNLAGAHLADVQQARELTLSRCALTGTRSSDDRPPNALKIPARQGGIYALTETGASPLHAEPRQPEAFRCNVVAFVEECVERFHDMGLVLFGCSLRYFSLLSCS